MGLLVHTSFETREGIPISAVYAHIRSLGCDFRGYFIGLTIQLETYLTRDKRLQGAAPLFVPTIPYRVCIEVPYTTQWGDMDFLYAKVKETLEVTTEDVFEDPPQPPTPAEPTSTEPAPVEPPAE